MNPNRPDLNGNEVLTVLVRTLLHNPMDKARKDAKIVLRRCDNREVSLALASAWSNEDDSQVANAILDILRVHNNEVAKRLFKTMSDETKKQREIIWEALESGNK